MVSFVPPLVKKRKGIGACIISSVVFAFVAMVMAVVCIQAGAPVGNNENMYIGLLNTSDFGQDLLPNLLLEMEGNLTDLSSRDAADDLSARFLGESANDAIEKRKSITDSVTSALDDSLGKVKSLINGFTGDLSDKLGIPDFFALHVKNVCWGKFGNASSLECSPTKPGYGLDLDQYLNQSLTAGPLKISLAYFVSEDVANNIHDASHAISAFVTAVFAFYTIAASSAAMVIILGVVFYFHLATTETKTDYALLNNWLVNLNLIFSAVGAFAMLLAAACSTGAMNWAHNQLVDVGKTLNISFDMGMKFITISWIAALFAFLALLINVFIMVKARKEKKRSYAESNYSTEKPEGKQGILRRLFVRR